VAFLWKQKLHSGPLKYLRIRLHPQGLDLVSSSKYQQVSVTRMPEQEEQQEVKSDL